MKIGIDIRTLMDARYSGVSEHTYHLLKAILSLDETNEYRLFYNSGKDLSGRLPKFDQPNASTIAWRWPNKLFNYGLQKTLDYPKINEKLGVDVFYSPHINFTALSSAGKKIITIHDLSYLRYPRFFSWRKNVWHSLIAIKKLIRQYDTIVAVSDNTRNDIIELCKVDPGKIETVYPGLNPRFPASPSDLSEVKTVYGLPDKYILFLGTVEPRKNIDGLITAYGLMLDRHPGLSEYKLILAGGRGWKSAPIYSARDKSKYRGNIRFLGYVDDKHKPSLYSLASVFVYPSFYEGFGFPVLEAMASGTPVICSNVSSLPEVAGGAALIVDPHNLTDLATAMGVLLANKKICEDLRQKAFLNVRHYDWRNAARRYLQLFEA